MYKITKTNLKEHEVYKIKVVEEQIYILIKQEVGC